MSTISQSIPNFFSGISQQPDNRKRPGQVKDAVNAFPDFALGMLKRPGGKFVSKLHGATPSGKWFEILRDNNEKYIAQYADNVFRVWDLDGDTRMVNMGSNTGVPGTCNTTTVKTASDALNTAVADVAAKLVLLQTAEDTLTQTVAQTKHTVNQLFEVELEPQGINRAYPAINYGMSPQTQYLKTGVLEFPNGDEKFILNGAVESTHPAIAVTIRNSGKGFSAGSSTNQTTVTSTGSGSGLKLDVTVGSHGCIEEVLIYGTDVGTNYRTGDIVTIAAFAGAEFEVQALGKGTQRTNDYPKLASQGVKFYDLMQAVAPTKTAADVTTATTAYNTAKTNYDSAVTTKGSAQTTYDTAVTNCAITSIPSNGYLNGATADDIELLTLNDSTFVLNKKKVVALTALKNNRTVAQTIDGVTYPVQVDAHRAQVTITVVANNTKYIIALDGVDYDYTSHSSSATSDDIATGLANDINAGTAGFTATAIGSGVYITKASSFDIHVSAEGVSAETMFVITDSTANTSQLPLESKDGYVLKIVNSLDIDIDDMYLRFETDNGTTTGRGQWFETTAPDLQYQFDPLTMPHRLVSQADTSFTFEPVSWDERIVGDDDTNPVPSFVGGTIDHIFFYRNRLGFLSGQNVVLSKAADLFDFWNTTAQTATDDDPIDISVAGKKPVFLHYVQPTSVGLVLYSSVEQFLLTTDSDILSPKTAKVNTMSNYECDPNVEAVSLGISQAFVSKTPLFTRLFELNDISTDTPPLMSDITNVVPELIPQSVDSLKASAALSLVSLGEVGGSTLYQYRFLNRSREERAINSWYKWQLTGTLLTQFFDSSTFYAVVANGTDVYVQSYDVTQANEQGFLSLPTGEKTDVCLDLFNINPHRTYDTNTEKTRVFLPYDAVTGSTLNLLVLGEFGSILTPTIAGSAGSQYVDVDGDYRGKDLIIGYGYDMTIDLPKLFRYTVSNNNIQNDDMSSLIIHRLKFKVGLSGPVDYKVSITGIDPFTKGVTVTLPQQYNLNNVNMQASSTHVVPIYQRNENLAVQIIGNTPFPVSLLGLDWEGKLNQRFYRRG